MIFDIIKVQMKEKENDILLTAQKRENRCFKDGNKICIKNINKIRIKKKFYI